MKYGIIGYNLFMPGGTTRSNLNLFEEIKKESKQNEIIYFNALNFNKNDEIKFKLKHSNLKEIEFKKYQDLSESTDIDCYFLTKESFILLSKALKIINPEASIIAEIHGPIDLLEVDLTGYLKYVDLVRVSSEIAKKALLELFPNEELNTKTYCVSTSHIKYDEEVLNVTPTNNFLIHSRFDETSKDIAYAIKLFDYCVNKLGKKDMKLYINGYGIGKTLYKNFINEYSLQKNIFINELFPEMHNYLSTSRYETFGFSVMEALADGKRVALYPGDDDLLSDIYKEFNFVTFLNKDIRADAEKLIGMTVELKDKSEYVSDKEIYEKKYYNRKYIYDLMNQVQKKTVPIIEDKKLELKKFDSLENIEKQIKEPNGFMLKLKKLGISYTPEFIKKQEFIFEFMKKIYEKIDKITYEKDKNRVNDRTVFIESFHGKNFSGDPKYLAIALKKKYPMMKIYVSSINQLSDNEILKYGFHPIRLSSKKYFEIADHAKYLIINGNLLDKVNVTTNQIVIQTWHGFPLKKMVADLEDTIEREKQVRVFTPRMKKWDYLLSGSKLNTKLFNSAFNLEKNKALTILEHGYPRNEYLLEYSSSIEERERLMLKYFNEVFQESKKIILYCPTWRKDKRRKVSEIDLKQVISDLPDDYIIIIKLHPLEGQLRKYYKSLDKRIFCIFNELIDIQELYILADTLVTDYSSAMFDFMKLDKKIILLQEDQESYGSSIGYYFNMDNLLGGIKKVKSHADLINAILLQDDSNKINDLKNILEKDKIGTCDQIIQEIIK